MTSLKRAYTPYLSLGVNMAYALGNCILGFSSHSWWFITGGAYYAVLSAARFCILAFARRAACDPDSKIFAKQVVGILLIVLSFCLIGVNILSALKDRGTRHHEIIMIAIAAYSFTKLILAILGMIRAKKIVSPITVTLRNLTFADSVVSIFSLQRSMLASFPGLQEAEIQLLNIFTGTAVWITVLLLGLNLTGGKYVNMAKSKVASINRKIAVAAINGYKAIEKGTIDGYKKVEHAFVNSYNKIEDRFVAAYLTREDESVEEAKARLRNQNK